MDKHLLGTLAGIGIVADVTAGLIKRDQEKHRARIAQADAEAREARAASRADRQRKAEEKAQEREWAKGEVERERQRLAREHEAYLRAQEEAAERYYADMLEKRLQLIAEAERRSVSIQREKEEAYKAQLEKDALEREAKAARTLPPPDNPQAFFWAQRPSCAMPCARIIPSLFRSSRRCTTWHTAKAPASCSTTPRT